MGVCVTYVREYIIPQRESISQLAAQLRAVEEFDFFCLRESVYTWRTSSLFVHVCVKLICGCGALCVYVYVVVASEFVLG